MPEELGGDLADPLRRALVASTWEELRAGWASIEAAWDEALARARQLPEEALHQRVDEEFSFVETLRHLVFAVDKWFTAPVAGGPFSPIGLPNTGSLGFSWPGLDPAAAPTAAEAAATWAERVAAVREHLAGPEPDDLDLRVEVLENGAEPLRACFATVVEEAFWHLRYATRDLDVLTRPAPAPSGGAAATPR